MGLVINGGSSKSVTNANQTICAAVAGRRQVVITNLSLVGALTLKLGATAVAGVGIILATAPVAGQPGGTASIDGPEAASQIDGIMSAADATANNVAIVEI